MCEVVKQAHIDGNLYRDVKPENYRYDLNDGLIKLVDFGEMVPMPSNGTYYDGRSAGTMLTIAPEALYEFKYTRFSDIFSVGASIALMLNILDIADENETRISRLYPCDHENIVHNRVISDPIILGQLYELCDAMLQVNPAARMEFDEVQARLLAIKKLADQYPVSVKVVGIDAFETLNSAGRNRLCDTIIQEYDEVVFFCSSAIRNIPASYSVYAILTDGGR